MGIPRSDWYRALTTSSRARLVGEISDPVDVLRELRRHGARLGLVSNCDASEVAAWSHSPLHDAFDVDVFSCQVGCAKPEPEIYRECLRRLEVDAAESTFVGDGGSNELRGAREVGMRSVLFSGIIAQMWPERIPQLAEDANAHITDLSELLTMPLLWKAQSASREA